MTSEPGGLGQTGRRLLAWVLVAAAAGNSVADVTWLQKLVASDGQQDDQFGRSVALRGGLLAISAPLDDDAGPQSGSVYVFSKSGPGWVASAKLTPVDAMPYQVLGLAGLDLDTDRILVGATGDGANGAQSGAAYLFSNSAGSWTESAKLIPADGAPYDSFGWAVAIEGTTAVVASYLADGVHSDSGAVYVFTEEATGWVEQAKLTASDAFASDWFGYRLDLSGDTLAVGAPWDDDHGSRSGAVYLFERSGEVWAEISKLTPADAQPGDQFGHDVSLDGARLAVGAAYADGLAQNSGAAYVFVHDSESWSQQARLEAQVPAEFDGFGSRVALDGDALIVTSELDDNDLGLDAGAATLFTYCAGIWSLDVTLYAPDGQPADLYAADVAFDDGLALLGAARDDAPADDEGSAHVYRTSTPIGTPYCTASLNSSGQSARICASGSRVREQQDLKLIVEGLPATVPGLLYFGSGQIQIPFGDGTRCVGNGPHYRLWPFLHSDSAGHAVRAINWAADYAEFILAGTNLNFQFWFRDGAAGGAGFNLTDAVEIAFE